MTPEIAALDAAPHVIRIPNQIDVPVTKRIMRLVDTSAFQRLNQISQLGLVSYVYPGARHTRFEHSLGVYRNSLLFVKRLSQFDFFKNELTVPQIEALTVAALLHDIGHWPFCHPIEDIGMAEVPRHEDVAISIINDGELLHLFEKDWQFEPSLVVKLITGKPMSDDESLLSSILSGPIDVDKMDYLYRDSLHCGVPYGMNFDSARLINGLCVNEARNGIAISSKGKTAAEMMVFARYVMFSEVYWHHAVRSATAMIQRIFYAWVQENVPQCDDLAFFAQLDDRSVVATLQKIPRSDATSGLIQGLFGQKRQLYKCLLDYNGNQNPELFQELAHKPYRWLNECSDELAVRLTHQIGEKIAANEILIDAPPPGLEVQFKVEVNDGSSFDSLENISPVVQALAKKQFDDFVKRVRIFIHPRLRKTLDRDSAEECLLEILGEHK